MKTLSLLISFFFFFSLSATASECNLSKGQAGPFKVGMKEKDIFKVHDKKLIKRVDLNLEGAPTPALLIYLTPDSKKARKHELTLEMVSGEAYRIQVHSRTCKTKQGFHVGSTVGDLKKNFKKIDFATGEGNIFAIVEDLNMSFLLDFAAIPKDWDEKNIKNSVQVMQILVL